MSSVEEKIRLLGQRKESEELREYVDSLETDTLTELVSKKIHSTSFISFFNYLLEAFGDTGEAHEKRFRLVVSVVKRSQVQTVPAVHLKNIMVRLCCELHKFKTQHLVEMCSLCVEYVQRGNPTEQSWNDLLPVLLNTIMEREHVEYNGNDCTGFEYKTQMIQFLLMMEWSPNIITPLANMFITMPLTREEHAQVVNKLGQFIEKLVPLEVPAFVYQLLKLTKNQNGRSVFLRLQNYFGLRVYTNNAICNQDSESLDVIGNASDIDAIQAESTVLFHISESAIHCHDNVNDYLNSLKNLTKSPEFILHPFQLTALLTVSTVSFFETKVFDVLKASVFRSYAEGHRRKDSCWFREMVPGNEKLSKVVLQIISLSIQGRDSMLEGLINFTFFMLGSMPPFGKEAIYERIWALGHLTVLQVIKHKRSAGQILIQRLVNSIIPEPNFHQYVECLHILSKRYGLVLVENQSCLIELMERLIRVPRQSSDEILDAIIPLTKVSLTLRDHFIVLLRKGLFSCGLNTRQMAVAGFLKLITVLKFSNLGALSQSSSSSHSGPSVLTQTQISVSNTGSRSNCTFTNEALCLEVLSILRRCFMQQAEVKYKLYEGLYDAVRTNPDLGVPILELLWSHFDQYYELDEDSAVPIVFSKLFQVKDMDVVLLEPMGKFLYSIGRIVANYLEVGNADPSVLRFVNVFAKFSEKMGKCDLEHLQLNDGTDLLDVLPESQQKLLLLKEAISVYEALMGFNICSWGEHSENRANTILQLFKGYNRLIQFGKALGKPKKDDKGKNVTRPTQPHNDTTRRDGGGKKAFKPFATVLDFPCLEKILSLLYKTSVDWTSAEESNILRRNVEFNHFVMQTTINLLQQAKQQKRMTEVKKNSHYKHCKSIAALLFERCVSRFQEFANFDNTTAVLSVDAFYVLLQLVNGSYKDKWSSFLSYTTSESSDEVSLQRCLDVYKSLLESLNDDTPQDAETVRYFQTVINSLALLAEQIPLHSNPSLLDWLKQFIMTKNIKNKQISSHLVGFTFEVHVRFKSTTTLFKNVALKLNDVLGSVCDEKVEDFEDVTMITETNAGSVFICLCNTIKAMIDDIDWIVLRVRAEYLMITYPGEESIERRREFLKSKERSICCQICQLISIMTIIVDTAVTPGPYSEAVIKNNISLYTTLTNLTKYFTTRSNKVNVAFQQARFESVVKQTGKKLSPAVYRFIPFIEQNQNDGQGQTQAEGKKRADTNKLKMKVLKETRLIPKLVYEMEQFSKTVIQLSNKTQVDLARYVGQGTSRDFRIVDLKAVLQEEHDESNVDESTVDESIFGCDTEPGGDDSRSETENEEPATKKTKK